MLEKQGVTNQIDFYNNRETQRPSAETEKIHDIGGYIYSRGKQFTVYHNTHVKIFEESNE
jgi:hypothetical protein